MNATSTPLHVYICGRLAIEHGSMVLPETAFPARQGRRLWTFLVLHRQQPVARLDLANAVWGDDAPDGWDPALNALVSRLRRCLQPVAATNPGLTIHGAEGRYRLLLPRDSFVDLERAREALHRTDVLMRQARWSDALAEARVAMEIATRGFLDGEGASWIEGQRRMLADIRIHAAEATVEAELARGNPAVAEREAELLIALAPLRETGHQLLMRTLAASGNRAEAARVFARCRALLRQEAGLDPSSETVRLLESITNSDVRRTEDRGA